MIRSSKDRGLFDRQTTSESIKAIVLCIDSPGGEVTATDIIYHDILAFKEATGIPVYASIMSLGTSGAYYMGATSDQVKRATGLQRAKVITYSTGAGHDSNIYSRFPMQVNLLNLNLRNLFADGEAGFHYLWIPAD